MSSRPELRGPPEVFYDAREARKYTSSSRIINVQTEISERCVELLNIPPGQKRLILDIGCGSGLSGAVLEAAGHDWIGCDISRDMLRIARERRKAAEDQGGTTPLEQNEEMLEYESDSQNHEAEESDADEQEGNDSNDFNEEFDNDGEDVPPTKMRRVNASTELVQHDMGLGLPFRDGTFDGAISVSALQWLCYDNTSAQLAHSCLKRGSRVAFQFYPQNDIQATLIATAAAKAGFSGGIVVDFPNSAKAKKHYLCLSMDRSYRKPEAKAEASPDMHHESKQRNRMQSKNRKWVIQKKECVPTEPTRHKILALLIRLRFQRRLGYTVRPDSKFTGRKRKDRF